MLFPVDHGNSAMKTPNFVFPSGLADYPIRPPVDTDVLITHTPAYGILDYDGNIHYGSEELFSRISAVNPRLHLFGHIHSQNGIVKRDSTMFSNAAIMNADYTNQNSPNLIKIND